MSYLFIYFELLIYSYSSNTFKSKEENVRMYIGKFPFHLFHLVSHSFL